jgi:hypothetical protein
MLPTLARRVVSRRPGARPGTAPNPLGRNPRRQLTPDVSARNSSYGVEDPARGSILGGTGSRRE